MPSNSPLGKMLSVALTTVVERWSVSDGPVTHFVPPPAPSAHAQTERAQNCSLKATPQQRRRGVRRGSTWRSPPPRSSRRNKSTVRASLLDRPPTCLACPLSPSSCSFIRVLALSCLSGFMSLWRSVYLSLLLLSLPLLLPLLGLFHRPSTRVVSTSHLARFSPLL